MVSFMTDYWKHLAGDNSIEPIDLFLKVRDLYTACLKHLYNDPKNIPDFRIHFELEQHNEEDAIETGYPVCTVTRKSSQITESVIRDLSEIDNFENSFTWYQDDIFIVFDYRADASSPLLFITRAFWHELYQQLGSFGIRRLRMSYMYEPLIATGVMDFFYSFYRLDINLITTLSASTYESAYVNATVFMPRFENDGEKLQRRSNLDIVFREQIPFQVENLRQVRKILEMSDKYIALVVNKAGRIYGLTSEPPLLSECVIRLWGHLTWTITFEGGKISYYDARYHLHTERDNDLGTLHKLTSKMNPLNMDKLEAVILQAVRQRHGTILILGRAQDIQSEAERLCAAKNAIGIQRTNLSDKVGLLTYLTSIDGAMFMDYDCTCACIGAILDGDAVTTGSTARGARYNSTVNYITRRAQLGQEFVGIVVSEDGTVDAVTDSRIIRLNLNP